MIAMTRNYAASLVITFVFAGTMAMHGCATPKAEHTAVSSKPPTREDLPRAAFVKQNEAADRNTMIDQWEKEKVERANRQREQNYEDYLEWEGFTIGLWDGEGRMAIVAYSPAVYNRFHQLRVARASGSELVDLVIPVHRGTLVNVIQTVGDFTEVAIQSSPWESSSRNYIGKTGWVLTSDLVDKAFRIANPRSVTE